MSRPTPETKKRVKWLLGNLPRAIRYLDRLWPTLDEVDRRALMERFQGRMGIDLPVRRSPENMPSDI